MADRKRKGKAVFSSNQVTPRFKSLYHEAHFNSKISARRILPELILQADEHVFNPIRFQIHQRKWEKFTKPIQAVGHLMVKEFYANAWEPDKARRKQCTYTSMEIIAEQIYKFVYKTNISSSLPFPSIIAALCADAKIPAILDDTLIPQEPPIVAEAMARTREPRAKNLRQTKQATTPQQQPQEMEMQGIPVNMANLAIHRQREEEMNQERMRSERIPQEAAAQQARTKGKSREVVPDSEDEFVSSESEEF
ncbi:hypothetical protein PIB30_101475 [Stylosanthes scabra]|uniref:Uncharacterized protein n=1 Tax=Stylosanthes scabra TaxID=79078 RepID=A0ABU6RY27_9FABA|nr:hypothetical protein [Stylosanthes scabra]